MNRRELESRIARLEREAKHGDAPTPEVYLAAHRRTVARLHEKWADELGDPEGSLLTEEDYAILADDTPEQRRKDEEVVEAWSRDLDLGTEADAARAKLLAGRAPRPHSQDSELVRDSTGG